MFDDIIDSMILFDNTLQQRYKILQHHQGFFNA